MLSVIRKARANGVFLELNAHPERLDLSDVHCRMAKDEGVLVSIDSDAHDIGGFENLAYGVGQARRGWLEKKDVLNCAPLAELRKLLGARRERSARSGVEGSKRTTTCRMAIRSESGLWEGG